MILAIAAAWAASAAGLPLSAKVAGGVLALLAGVTAMRMAGGASTAFATNFEPVEFDSVEGEDEDVLLLEDRLDEPAQDSRVVQLFARPEPTPGELVLRISDYLSEQGKPVAIEPPAAGQQVDASAALHAALANIRANLR